MPKRILVVEDDGMLLEGIRDILEATGYEVRTAHSGLGGLQALLGGFDPHVIVSDVTMPKINGYELLQTVRIHPAWAAIPFIMLTGRGTHLEAPPPEANGVHAFIPKPFGADALVDAIEAALQ